MSCIRGIDKYDNGIENDKAIQLGPFFSLTAKVDHSIEVTWVMASARHWYNKDRMEESKASLVYAGSEKGEGLDKMALKDRFEEKESMNIFSATEESDLYALSHLLDVRHEINWYWNSGMNAS
jgi:hypothetical protein